MTPEPTNDEVIRAAWQISRVLGPETLYLDYREGVKMLAELYAFGRVEGAKGRAGAPLRSEEAQGRIDELLSTLGFPGVDAALGQ